MAALSPATQNRLFFFGVGLGTCAVVGLMRHLLIHYRDAAALPPSENKPQYITQEVEDSLKLSTLDKLLDSPNYCIQETTSTIVVERALHDDSTIDIVLAHITRADYETRARGVKALYTMMNNCSPATIRLINKPATYFALVKALEYCVTDYKHNDFDLEWDNWVLRDRCEQDCFLILTALAEKFGVGNIIKAGFIHRWLAKEPWGNEEKARQINFLESLRTRNQLNELLLPLIREMVGRKKLCEARLLPQDFEWDRPGPRDVRMTNGEGTAGEEEIWGDGRRRRDQSQEEQVIRRRHREAIVLNDGTRPLGREDIIERER
ncbi:hypothetical protein B0J14DRAFT_91000 [Halenospora varia]|nr:hypothetical protein B0J14DRAFT_91000 [Halenospora varia]